MTDFSAKVPVDPDKAHELHDQSKHPKAPIGDRSDLARRFFIVGVGTLLALVFTAVGVDFLDGWDARRNPLVPGVATTGALGGIAAAYLIAIRSFGQFWVGMLLVILSVGGLFLMHLARAYADSDAIWISFAVAAGILHTAAMIYFIYAWATSQRYEEPGTTGGV